MLLFKQFFSIDSWNQYLFGAIYINTSVHSRGYSAIAAEMQIISVNDSRRYAS